MPIRAPWSQPKTTIGRSAGSAARPRCMRWRKAPIGELGKSMPVTSSAALRNGVDDGQAPAQMPQLVHRSASTWAICLPIFWNRSLQERSGNLSYFLLSLLAVWYSGLSW